MHHHVLRSTMLAVMVSASAAAAQGQGLPASSLTFPAGAPRVEIPFMISRGAIVLQATVNGEGPLRLILDSGAPVMLFPDSLLAHRLRLGTATMANVGGAGQSSGPRLAPLATGVTVAVGGATVTEGVAIWGLQAGLLGALDGVIGAPLFQQATVEIDFNRERITLHDPSTFTFDGGGTVLPLELRPNGHLYTTVALSIDSSHRAATEVVLHLDTGARQALSLWPRAPLAGIPPTPRLINTIVARGTQGSQRGDVAWLPELTLGGVPLRDVLTMFPSGAPPDGEDGWVGLPLLSRFRVIIDAPHGRLILTQRVGAPTPHWHNTLGLFFDDAFVNGDTLPRVMEVLPGSPAEEAGITAGDQLEAIDGVPVRSATDDALHALLAHGPGTTVELRFTRGNARPLTRSLVTRDLVPRRQ